MVAITAALAGCGTTTHPINCDVARLQKDAGRSEQEIAASFQANPDEVEKCFASPAAPAASAATPPPPVASPY
ncbi:MAG TPA: hypothetical protein VGI47_11015 [Candidatus Binataceae bacterium]